MKTIATLLITLFTLGAARAADQHSFATEARVTLDQATGHYLIVAKVSELVTEQDAEETLKTKDKVPVLFDIHESAERLIAAPRMTVVAGQGASITDTQSDGTSVRAEVFWPQSGTDNPTSLVITVRSKGKLLTRSTFKLDLKKT